MSIPIFIITRDRVTDLIGLLDRLDGHENVVLVDCASTYEPLLEFLEETDRKVVKLDDNLGHHAPWLAGLVPTRGKYVVTDPDVIPIAECPDDFVEYLSDVVDHHPVIKAGLGLEINDLPDHYKFKEEVRKWEKQFWTRHWKGERSRLHDAPVDTTFAVYAPGTSPAIAPAIRTGHPYMARHMPWYANSDKPTAEEIYYKEHASPVVATWVYDDLLDVALKAELGIS